MPDQIPATPRHGWRVALTALGLSAALLSGCAIYKPEIAQGNVVSREQAAVLQPGMTRAQVAQVLGTPLLTDLFRPDRWDYIFTIKNRKGTEPQRYAMAVFFQGDTLTRVEGAETLPSETEFVRVMGEEKTFAPRNLEAAPDKLQAFAEQEKARPQPPATPLPTAPSTTSYPQLPQ